MVITGKGRTIGYPAGVAIYQSAAVLLVFQTADRAERPARLNIRSELGRQRRTALVVRKRYGGERDGHHQDCQQLPGECARARHLTIVRTFLIERDGC